MNKSYLWDGWIGDVVLFYVVDHNVQGGAKWIENAIYTILNILVVVTFFYIEFKKAKKQRQGHELDSASNFSCRNTQTPKQAAIMWIWILLAFFVDWLAKYRF